MGNCYLFLVNTRALCPVFQAVAGCSSVGLYGPNVAGCARPVLTTADEKKRDIRRVSVINDVKVVKVSITYTGGESYS